jgi:lysozyme
MSLNKDRRLYDRKNDPDKEESMSSTSRVQGIDVSKWQSKVNWQSVKEASIAFAFARATYGNTEVDSEFKSNWQGMKDADIIRGPYHFFVAADDPTAQANLFVNTVGSLDSGDLPPVLDVEADSGTSSTLVADVQTWLDAVEQMMGRRPIIYTAPSYWNQYLTDGFSSYPLWVAEYGVSAPKSVNGWSEWTFWQYSESGNVGGLNPADLDYFNGSLESLSAFINSLAGPAIRTTPVPSPADSARTYTVQSGDTLSSIAARYDVTLSALEEANNIENANLIEVGQVLTIP